MVEWGVREGGAEKRMYEAHLGESGLGGDRHDLALNLAVATAAARHAHLSRDTYYVTKPKAAVAMRAKPVTNA